MYVPEGIGTRGEVWLIVATMVGKMGGIFAALVRFAQRVRFFFSRSVWSVESEGYSPLMRRLLHLARIVLLVMRGFAQNSVQLRASALTFYTVLSLIPILALGFGIAKGFGMEKRLDGIIRDNLSSYPEVADKLVTFSSALLDRTGGGVVAGVGVVMLLWTIVKVFNNIESSFNAIWQIDTPRSWLRRFSDYLSMMLIAPVVILLASSANVYAQSLLTQAASNVEIIGALKPYILLLLRVVPYLLVSFVFMLLYMVMPNTRVKIRSAFTASLVAGIVFMVAQWGYIYFQFGVSKYNAIYGSFAALPLFLVWCQLSWLIVLLGAELSYAVQNVHLYEYEEETNNLSVRRAKELSLLLLSTILQRFERGDAPLTSEQLSRLHGLPLRLTRRLIHWMAQSNLVSAVVTPSEKVQVYQPGRPMEYYSVGAVLCDFENYGSTIDARGDVLPLIEQLYDAYLERQQGESRRALAKLWGAEGV